MAGGLLTVTLPKRWTTAMNLRRNDPVLIAPQRDGTLRISVEQAEERMRRRQTFNVDSFPDESSAFRSLIGAYIAGYYEIFLQSDTPIPPHIRAVVNDFCQMTVGQVLLEETETMIHIRAFLNNDDMPYNDSLKRMFEIAKTMHVEAVRSVLESDPSRAQEVLERDRDIKRLLWLIARQTNLILRHPGFSACADESPAVIGRHAMVAWWIDRAADHAVRIAKSTETLEKGSLSSEIGIDGSSSFAVRVFDQAAAAFCSRDATLANLTIEEIRQASPLLKQLNPRVSTLPDGSTEVLETIADAVRRLVECAGDIAEMAINDAVEFESEV
jgi:phosphate uptake regulator